MKLRHPFPKSNISFSAWAELGVAVRVIGLSINDCALLVRRNPHTTAFAPDSELNWFGDL